MRTRKTRDESLSARERQIMEVVHRLESASARDIQREMPDAPSYSAVRTLIRILVEKGFLKIKDGKGRYFYEATVSKKKAGVSALRNLIATFFNSSAENALTTLLSSDEMDLDEEELDRLSLLIEEAKAKKTQENTSKQSRKGTKDE